MGQTQYPGGMYAELGAIRHLEEHLRWMIRAGRSDRTMLQRRQYLTYLLEFLGHDPFLATEDDLERWQDSLPRHRIQHHTAEIRPYYKWIHAKGYRPDNPAVLLVSPKMRRGIPRPIPLVDLLKAIDQAPPRVLPWLLLAAYSGLRAKEIAALRVEDFEHYDGRTFIRLTITKGEVPRTAPVPGWVWTIIRPLMAPAGRCWRRERGFGVVTPLHVSQIANKYLHSIGIPDTFHSLRHWAGTEVLEATDNLRLTSEFLGHLSLDSTIVYTKIRPLKLHEAAELLPRPAGFRRLAVAAE